MVFPVAMYGCESWAIEKAEHWRVDAFAPWCWRSLLRVHWTARRSNHPKGDQSWVFIGRADVEAKNPILWPPDEKSWLIWKDPDAGKDWGQEEKGTTEKEMVGWHHRLDGHGFVWTPGVGDGHGGMACCDSWGRKELDMTKQLNWADRRVLHSLINELAVPQTVQHLNYHPVDEKSRSFFPPNRNVVFLTLS